MVEHEHVTGLFTAEHVPAGQHAFKHVAVADLRLHVRDAGLLHGELEAQIRHDGGDQRVVLQGAGFLHAKRQDAHDLVAVDFAAERINRQAAVSVTVKRNAEVSSVVDNGLLQRTQVGRADTVVDVEAIRTCGNDRDVGTGLTQCRRADDGGGTVSAVDNHAQSLQRSGCVTQSRYEVFGEFVCRCRVRLDAADVRAGGTIPVGVEQFKDFVFRSIVEFGAAGAEEFDAVVRHGVVAG